MASKKTSETKDKDNLKAIAFRDKLMAKSVFPYYLSGHFLTDVALASNNRGENEGNQSLLPKMIGTDGTPRVMVSSQSIRKNLRMVFQHKRLPLNHIWNYEEQSYFPLVEPSYNPDKFIDDDILGYMNASKNETLTRKSPLSVTPAMSTATADNCIITFNTRSPFFSDKKQNKDGEMVDVQGNPMIYAEETLTTAFQWGMMLDVNYMRSRDRVVPLLESIHDLGSVGGNQTRYGFDFSPVSAIYRWSKSMVRGFTYPFLPVPGIVKSNFTISREVFNRIKCGAIPASELWIVGDILECPYGGLLKSEGANCFSNPIEGIQHLSDRVLADIEAEGN